MRKVDDWQTLAANPSINPLTLLPCSVISKCCRSRTPNPKTSSDGIPLSSKARRPCRPCIGVQRPCCSSSCQPRRSEPSGPRLPYIPRRLRNRQRSEATSKARIAQAQVEYVASTVARSKTPTFSTASTQSGRRTDRNPRSGLPLPTFTYAHHVLNIGLLLRVHFGVIVAKFINDKRLRFLTRHTRRSIGHARQ